MELLRYFWVLGLLLTLACGYSFAAEPTATPGPSATPRPTNTVLPTLRAATPTARAVQPTVAPFAKLISAGSYKLYMECTGSCSPTVVFDSGLSATGRSWSQVAPQAAKLARVCTYDRANTGRSERAATPRTSQHLVNDLRTLLKNAGIQPPYVLVGHSLGGLNVRLFASEYRSDVAGIVLVDSAHEDEWERFGALLPPAFPGEPPQFKDFRKQLTDPIMGTEHIDIKTSGDQMKAMRQSFGDMPLYVISHGKPVADVPAVVSPIFEQVWSDLQKDLLRWSSNSRQIIAAQSDHGIPSEQPELVVDAVREELDAIRNR